MKLATAAFLMLVLAASSSAQEGTRDEKLISLFNIVKFPNDVCAGTTRNGTCYTAEECTSVGGTSDGSCASGYGVCCVVKLACGASSSENNTYLINPEKVASCTYSICPISSDVTRIRFNFENFVLSQPVSLSSVAVAVANPDFGKKKGAVGNCVTDSFVVASPGKTGSPVICGKNSGQHMVIDSNGMDCMNVAITIGGATATRSWTIVASQYVMGTEELTLAGPSGCLQYFTGESGFAASFNFDIPGFATTTNPVSHLANQAYDICFRREKKNCHICYSAIPAATAGVTDQGTYGLSKSKDDGATQGNIGDTDCTADFITIPEGGTKADIEAGTAGTGGKYCGRFLAVVDAATAHVTVCTLTRPFRLSVTFDGDELDAVTDASMATMNEGQGVPTGTLGFGLTFKQGSTGC